MSQIFTNCQLLVQGAADGNAIAFTAITKANPAVVSAAAHGLANGAVFYIATGGYNEVTGRVFRVANQAAGTFELEGVDSTNFGAFTAGTVRTCATTVGLDNVKGTGAAGGEAEGVDVTTIHDSQKVEIPGMNSSAMFDLTLNWRADNTGQALLQSLADSRAVRAFQLVFPSGQRTLFRATVGMSGMPQGDAGGLATTKCKLMHVKRQTAYAT